MQECPSKRLACYTTGDSCLHFYDKNVANKWEEGKSFRSVELDAYQLHEAAGSKLETIWGSFYY